MTKGQLAIELGRGKTVSELFPLKAGQECDIYKANHFSPGDEIIYIPDIYMNHIWNNCDVDEVLPECYTGNDFIAECGGREDLAEQIFEYVDWQHPSTAIDEYCMESDETQDPRTYVVTELCPHCEREVEIHGWVTERDGYQAFCPYCGESLMLCDECQHSEQHYGCDFDASTGLCLHRAHEHLQAKGGQKR